MKKIAVLIFGAILLAATPGLAADSVGKVTFIKGDVWLARGGQKLDAALDSAVFPGDSVVTEASGRVRLAMADDSVIYVGSHSRVVIDDYDVKQGNLKQGSFNLLWGKARFLVAKVASGKKDFSVKTSTATMGVRGTQFAVRIPKAKNIPAKVGPVMPEGLKPDLMPTNAMLFEGALIGTNIKGVEYMIKPNVHVTFNPNGLVIKRPIEPADVKRLGIPVLKPVKRKAAAGKLAGKPPDKADPAKPKGKEPKAKEPKAREPRAKELEPKTKKPKARLRPEVKEPEAKKPKPRQPAVKHPKAKDLKLRDPEPRKGAIVKSGLFEPPIDPVKAPEVKKPEARKPAKVKAPEVRKPEVKKPTVKAPATRAPTVKAPRVKAPRVKAPRVKAPRVRAPKVRAPKVRAPKVRAPKVKRPVFRKLVIKGLLGG